MTPTLTDYLTGEPIRPATREEWRRSTDAERTNGTGAFTLDGRAVFVDGDFLTAAHTPEPWSYAEDGGGSAFSFEIRADRRDYGGQIRGIALVYADNPDDGSPGTEDTANAARIVACVNACAGMDNPAAVLAEVRSALDIAAFVLDESQHPETLRRVRAALALLDGGLK